MCEHDCGCTLIAARSALRHELRAWFVLGWLMLFIVLPERVGFDDGLFLDVSDMVGADQSIGNVLIVLLEA